MGALEILRFNEKASIIWNKGFVAFKKTLYLHRQLG
jgi:hypothetical protein